MKKNTSFKILLMMALMFSSVNVGLLSPSASSNSAIGLDAVKLVIGTRHDSSIYTLFAKEFVESSYAADVGITDVNEITFKTPTTFDAFKRVMTEPTIGADLGWGGGPTLFNTLAADGAVTPITDTDLLAEINEAVPDTLAGVEMKEYNDDDEMIWAANAISSFGFTVNNKELEERGLDKPTSWEDLASPDFYTSASEFNIGLGNAPDTTSNTRIYQIILQKFGWEKGWEVIYQMTANGKIYGGSVETLSSVISGETAVAMTIDFYGVNAMAENSDTEYIVPINGSIANGDPIAFAKNPPHMDAAKAFVKFAFSPEGQALWLDSNINRLPVREDAFQTDAGKARQDIYALFNSTIANKGIDFSEELAQSLEEPMRFHFENTITRVHSRHRSSWGTMIDAYRNEDINETTFEELRAVLIEPAMTMAEAQAMNTEFNADQAVKREKEDLWYEFASQKYDTLKSKFIELGIQEADVEDVPFSLVSFFFGFMAVIAITYTLRRRKL